MMIFCSQNYWLFVRNIICRLCPRTGFTWHPPPLKSVHLEYMTYWQTDIRIYNYMAICLTFSQDCCCRLRYFMLSSLCALPQNVCVLLRMVLDTRHTCSWHSQFSSSCFSSRTTSISDPVLSISNIWLWQIRLSCSLYHDQLFQSWNSIIINHG